MAKPLKPTDGRLKANRDFHEFMMRAVHIPSMQRAKGEFPVEADEPLPCTRSSILERPTTDFYDRFSDRQLLLVLHGHLQKQIEDKHAAVAIEIAAELYWRQQPEPAPALSQEQRVAQASSVDDLTDADLLWVLAIELGNRGLLLERPGNILSHLRARARKRGQGS